MINEDKFGLAEAVYLTTLIIVSKILYTSTSVVVKSTGTAAWYTTLISCAVSIFFFFLITKLMDRFPSRDIMEIYQIVLGKYLGSFICILFSSYVLFYSSSILREFEEMIKAYSLPYTPPSIIMASATTIAVLIAYKGIHNIARLAYLAFFIVMCGIVIILILSIPNYNFGYLKPLGGYGIARTLKVAVFRTSAYGEVLILALIVTSLENRSILKKAGILSLLLSGLVFSVTFLLYISAFGYSMGMENLSGMFQMSKNIYYTGFFQRVETIFLFIWVISSLLAVAISFYSSVAVYCKTFKITNHRPLLLPFSFLMYTLSFIPKNISEVIQINLTLIRQYSFPITFLMPILVLLISIVASKKEV